MIFSDTITFGEAVTILTIIVTGLTYAATHVASLKSIVRRLEAVEREIKILAEIMVAMARHDEKLSALERRVSKIESK